MGVVRSAPQRVGAGFWVALAGGWALIGYGIALLVRGGGAGRVRDVGVWIVGLDLAHDLVLAPLTLLLAVAVSRVVGPRVARGPLLAGLGATTVVLLLSWPLLGRYGADPRNPTVLPLDYPVAVATVLAVVWGLVVAVIAARVVVARSSSGPHGIETRAENPRKSTSDSAKEHTDDHERGMCGGGLSRPR